MQSEKQIRKILSDYKALMDRIKTVAKMKHGDPKAHTGSIEREGDSFIVRMRRSYHGTHSSSTNDVGDCIVSFKELTMSSDELEAHIKEEREQKAREKQLKEEAEHKKRLDELEKRERTQLRTLKKKYEGEDS